MEGGRDGGKTEPNTYHDVDRTRNTKVKAVGRLLALLLDEVDVVADVVGTRVSLGVQPTHAKVGDFLSRENILCEVRVARQPLLPHQAAKRTWTPSETSGSKRAKRRRTFRPSSSPGTTYSACSLGSSIGSPCLRRCKTNVDAIRNEREQTRET